MPAKRSPTARVRPLLTPCNLCEVRCGVDRLAGERGPCGVGLGARVYNAFVHLGEEPELVPCFAVFLSGCNFRCVFCSDGDAVDDPGVGRPLDAAALAARVAATPGLASVEFVGGVPDVNLLAVAECAEVLPPGLPLVLNTNGYATVEALDAMEGWVDVLVTDFKFGPGDCARRLAQVERYWHVVTRNLQRSAPRFRSIVRHLLMPGHLECCTRPVMRWLAEWLPGVQVNVMTGYRPLHRARAASGPLGGRVPGGDLEAVLSWPSTRGLQRLVVDGRPLPRRPRRVA